ncbi:hypothetical protein EDD18DRAFT_1312467 [Armillaria luteobubalina]|uniref:CxC1-like cysteine cluster associated with KDZ transposases domain-containing protein n=1 Tax=Armillaria luteobubalina TaxID=153913 RepID=A0AA39UHR4_9AGAR|nr:hypothetical protein EDD18DRAFT_1312467 [Armillaria luteobubalina]
MIPCAPKRPGLVVTFRVMEIFHAAILRCPQLLVQVSGALCEQFSICYDIFIAILENVEQRVMRELDRSSPDWRLKNCCAACTFELEGEEQLEFSMFRAMDGNDSLKREAIGDVEVVDLEGASPCEERWKNMSDDRMSKMWGVFEETGFFLSLCHHGSVLLGADMVKSGEQAKYPLAVVVRLLEVFGEHLGIGYDIGCKFGGTINRSPLGQVAKTKGLRVLVGLFHGHAHNHLCQLRNLGTYLKGLGLEDLETLECFFSKSNALARGIHYASSFLCNNYRQALDIIDNYPALQKSMLELSITDEKEFEVWLEEEEAYLSGLQHELLEETVEMEYYTRLIEGYHQSKGGRSQELERVQDLECSLSISPEECWTIGSEKWKENEQRGLIVARIFELTKMNMSHTGYKMRKHIGKALKARSQAIRTTLSHYNAAASALCPPRPPLQWERVVKYAFLADFDLLRDVQENMSERKWATLAGRQAMDTYFKICQAKEEIKRLNIEIQRVITYMHVEDTYLRRREGAIVETVPALALQISRYCQDREHFYATHMRRFYALSRDAGFTGSVEVGDNSEDEDGEDAVHEQVQAIMQVSEDTTRE